MDDQHFQPKTIAEVFGARDQTQLSTCISRPSETSRPKPSAKIRDLVSRLGLRYRPTNAADLDAHAAMLALLAQDLADIPYDLLDRAISRHVMISPYMPKAADLVKLAREIDDARRPNLPNEGATYAHRLAASYNQRGNRPDVEWYVNDNGEVKIRHRDPA